MEKDELKEVLGSVVREEFISLFRELVNNYDNKENISREETNSLKLNNRTLSEENESLQAKNTELSAKNIRLEENFGRMKSDIDSLSAEKNSLYEENKSLREERDKLSDKATSQEDYIKKLTENINSLSAENQSLNKDKEKFRSMYDEYVRKYKELFVDMGKKNERIKELENNLSDLRIDNQKLNNTITEHEKTFRELRSAIADLQKHYDSYRENFGKLNEVFEIYKNLSVISSYNQIVSDRSPLEFHASGTEEDNLKLMFDKICMEYSKYDEQTLKDLNTIFDFLFEEFSSVHTRFKRIPTNVGDSFDLDSQTLTGESRPVGKVEKVIIRGYTNNGNKNYKSFVKIGG